MRILLVGILAAVAYVIVSCADMNAPGGGIDDPLIPSTPSIMPLNVGSEWEYLSSWYDTSGTKIQLSDRVLTRAIREGLVLENDSTLVTPNNATYYSVENSSRYVYKLEWEYVDSGLLVRPIGTGDLDKRGLYIAGVYVHMTTTLYHDPVRWLAYPAKKGTTYTVAFPGEDSSEIKIIQVMETAATFYAPVQNRVGASPVLFKDSCYLYKETYKSSETYYYYHPDIGCLGYLRYVNNKLVTSYIMTKYRSNILRY